MAFPKLLTIFSSKAEYFETYELLEDVDPLNKTKISEPTKRSESTLQIFLLIIG